MTGTYSRFRVSWLAPWLIEYKSDTLAQPTQWGGAYEYYGCNEQLKPTLDRNFSDQPNRSPVLSITEDTGTCGILEAVGAGVPQRVPIARFDACSA